ncbi:Cell differentiation protein rcd1 [Tieghemostelium lacteum]|uniref:Cell differentiation protein rcd1 n=1 Tax=Tieghemostelium lacteum TaxID=361077 RepID=A0A151Z6V3_TIELA|nr:Cell differentiation protein rcd1 [Tieghemostelium lacteum]|eukprot:KYQ89514.1 Cell differentiation protein rcd1 [Tieghemostelium lacteum]
MNNLIPHYKEIYANEKRIKKNFKFKKSKSNFAQSRKSLIKNEIESLVDLSKDYEIYRQSILEWFNNDTVSSVKVNLKILQSITVYLKKDEFKSKEFLDLLTDNNPMKRYLYLSLLLNEPQSLFYCDANVIKLLFNDQEIGIRLYTGHLIGLNVKVLYEKYLVFLPEFLQVTREYPNCFTYLIPKEHFKLFDQLDYKDLKNHWYHKSSVEFIGMIQRLIKEIIKCISITKPRHRSPIKIDFIFNYLNDTDISITEKLVSQQDIVSGLQYLFGRINSENSHYVVKNQLDTLLKVFGHQVIYDGMANAIVSDKRIFEWFKTLDPDFVAELIERKGVEFWKEPIRNSVLVGRYSPYSTDLSVKIKLLEIMSLETKESRQEFFKKKVNGQFVSERGIWFYIWLHRQYQQDLSPMLFKDFENRILRGSIYGNLMESLLRFYLLNRKPDMEYPRDFIEVLYTQLQKSIKTNYLPNLPGVILILGRFLSDDKIMELFQIYFKRYITNGLIIDELYGVLRAYPKTISYIIDSIIQIPISRNIFNSHTLYRLISTIVRVVSQLNISVQSTYSQKLLELFINFRDYSLYRTTIPIEYPKYLFISKSISLYILRILPFKQCSTHRDILEYIVNDNHKLITITQSPTDNIINSLHYNNNQVKSLTIHVLSNVNKFQMCSGDSTVLKFQVPSTHHLMELVKDKMEKCTILETLKIKCHFIVESEKSKLTSWLEENVPISIVIHLTIKNDNSSMKLCYQRIGNGKKLHRYSIHCKPNNNHIPFQNLFIENPKLISISSSIEFFIRFVEYLSKNSNKQQSVKILDFTIINLESLKMDTITNILTEKLNQLFQSLVVCTSIIKVCLSLNDQIPINCNWSLINLHNIYEPNNNFTIFYKK